MTSDCHPIPPCHGCGAADVLVLSPGAEDVREAGIVLARGRRVVGWCEACARAVGWPARRVVAA